MSSRVPRAAFSLVLSEVVSARCTASRPFGQPSQRHSEMTRVSPGVPIRPPKSSPGSLNQTFFLFISRNYLPLIQCYPSAFLQSLFLLTSLRILQSAFGCHLTIQMLFTAHRLPHKFCYRLWPSFFHPAICYIKCHSRLIKYYFIE